MELLFALAIGGFAVLLIAAMLITFFWKEW